jgi:DNA-3-methyladenine glycosylase I
MGDLDGPPSPRARQRPGKAGALLDSGDDRSRCAWVNLANRRYVAYHDVEWGVPVHGDRRLFELLTLEGAQAGLSWETILNKRAGYRRAFARFDPARVARFTGRDVRRLLGDPGIVRHEGKIRSTIGNARALLALQRELGSFDRFVWGFVGGTPLRRKAGARGVPARTPESDALSAALKARGFSFVGSTICYAFMQAAGMVDDHARSCFRARPAPPLQGAPRASRTWKTPTAPSG